MKNITALLSMVILGLVSFLGWQQYQAGLSKHLDEARAYRSIAENELAIGSYKAHLLGSPSDTLAKVEYADLLNEIDQRDKAVALWESVYTDTENDSLRDALKTRISGHYDQIARALEDSAKAAIASKDYMQAAIYLEEEGKIRAEKAHLSIFGSYFMALTVKRREIDAAYYYWLAGNATKTNEILVSSAGAYIDTTTTYQDWITEKASSYALKVFERGGSLFDEKKWSDSRKAFQEVERVYGETSGLEGTLELDAKYNVAMTYHNENKYTLARKELLQIKVLDPEYDTQQVNKAMARAAETRHLYLGDQEIKKASAKFEAKSWAQARSHYRRAIEHYKQGGLDGSDEAIAQANFNLAIAYGNDGDPKRAYNVLVRLRKESPNYYLQTRVLEETEDYWRRITPSDRPTFGSPVRLIVGD